MLAREAAGTAASIRSVAPACAVTLAYVTALAVIGPATLANDSDGDGVPDNLDVCQSTPVGFAVDAEGRPLADVDLDCDTDLADVGVYQAERLEEFGFAQLEPGMTGPLPRPLPAMMLVPGGSFMMGDPFAEGQADERPVHPVQLGAYRIDTCEVTGRQYAVALNWALAQGDLITVEGSTVCKYGTYGTPAFVLYCETDRADGRGVRWDGRAFSVAVGSEDHPMIGVTWHGAAAYCNWRSAPEGRAACYDVATWACDFAADGYRLPTEAEWERAAAWDPGLERHFRFGEHTDGCGADCLSGERANFYHSGDPFEIGGPYAALTTPVAFYDGRPHGDFATKDARSPSGCYDLTGNVWEWCHDWYSATYYGESPDVDPRGPASGSQRVVRGGAWNNTPQTCRSADRAYLPPYADFFSVGFRCARQAE